MYDTARIPQERQEIRGEVVHVGYVRGTVGLRQGVAVTIRDSHGRFEVTFTMTSAMTRAFGCADAAGHARLLGQHVSVHAFLRPSLVEHGDGLAHFQGLRPTRPLLLSS